MDVQLRARVTPYTPPDEAISARLDYAAALQEFGITDEDVQQVTHSVTVHDIAQHTAAVGDSLIEGKGLFALRDIACGENIMHALIEGKKTIAGRYMNHSGCPNTTPEQDGEDFMMVATADIKAGDEMTIDYRPQLVRAGVPQISRAQVLELEAAVKELPQLDGDKLTSHHFAPGVYVRELFIPKGAVVTGAIHKYELFNILAKGKVRVNTNTGVETLTAPYLFKQATGAKRAFYAFEDSVWLNIFPTDLTDPDEIEKEFTTTTFEALEAYQKECI